MKLTDLFEWRGGEWRCTKCESTTPHKEKARRHAWSKHGVEIDPEPVVVKYPEKMLTPEENAIIVITEEPAVTVLDENINEKSEE